MQQAISVVKMENGSSRKGEEILERIQKLEEENKELKENSSSFSFFS